MIMGVHLPDVVFMSFPFILENGPLEWIVFASTAYSDYFKFV